MDQKGYPMNRKEFEAIVNVGSRLIAVDPQRAIRIIKQGLLIQPKDAIGWYNLGIALHEAKKIKGSIASYKKALECKNPPSDRIINNLAQDLLLNRNFEEGWKL